MQGMSELTGRSIAIIGAGMAGLAAARLLQQAGARVALIEKSRGVGGRMATRRVGALQFDHGAQYFTARGQAFKAAVEDLARDGAAAPWFDDAHVGAPGMSGAARALAQGLEILTGRQASALERTGARWRVRDGEGPVVATAGADFDALALAVPAPQAAPLLASAGLSFPQIAQAAYAPCWALMLAFDARSPAPARMKPEDSMLAWIARDSDKPGRAAGAGETSGETWVVHAGAGWSREHLELSPDDAGALMLARFRALTGITQEPAYMTTHRWRYALVERAGGPQPAWDAQARVGACGDWACGARVEAAFDSGEALARAMIADLAR
jgi:renalase